MKGISGPGPGDGREWFSRPIAGHAATKVYRCPFCDHEVPVGQPHTVAWPDDDVEGRRHWHTACWRRASRSASRE